MKILDYVENQILTIDDRMDAIREAYSRVKWYKRNGIDSKYVVNVDEITIRRVEQ